MVGICDTPAELFFRISLALGKPLEDIECDYLGLNHLGWVRAIRVRSAMARSQDVTARVLNDDEHTAKSLSSRIIFTGADPWPGPRFPRSICTFITASEPRAPTNLPQARPAVRNCSALNQRIFDELESNVRRNDLAAALQAYRAYLNRRNASYMHLEGSGKSAFAAEDVDWDPFAAATGYHRIAVETILALARAGTPPYGAQCQEREGHPGTGGGGCRRSPLRDRRFRTTSHRQCGSTRTGGRSGPVGEELRASDDSGRDGTGPQEPRALRYLPTLSWRIGNSRESVSTGS